MCRLETAGSRRNPLFFALLRRSSWSTRFAYIIFSQVLYTRTLPYQRVPPRTHTTKRVVDFEFPEKKNSNFAAKSTWNSHYTWLFNYGSPKRNVNAKRNAENPVSHTTIPATQISLSNTRHDTRKHVSLPGDGLCQSTLLLPACLLRPTNQPFPNSTSAKFVPSSSFS